MVNHRNRVTMLLAVMLTLLLSACAVPAFPPADSGVAPAAPAATDGVTTITWAMWGSPEEIASHQRVADAFMSQHPEIRIELMSEPWSDYFTKMQTLWASGDSSVIPDVAFLWPTPQYAAQGVLENLDPYIESSGYDLNDYWPALLESAMYEGSVYGFPRDIETNVLYYNIDIFGEAGLDYPDDTWTWDDWQSAIEALTARNASGQVERYGLAMEGGKYPKFIGQNNAQILDDMRNPSECRLDQPEAIEAIEFIANLMNDGFAMRSAELSQAGGDAAIFQSGQAAMIVQNSSRVSAFNAADMNYDVSPVPIPADGKRSNGAGGAAWVMSAASDNKDAAWTFLRWLQSADGGQQIYTEAGEIFPALRPVAESDAFMDETQKPSNRQAFIIEAEAAEVGAFGYFPEWGELSGSIINPSMERIWVGEAAPADVLPQVCQQVNDFLAANGYPK